MRVALGGRRRRRRAAGGGASGGGPRRCWPEGLAASPDLPNRDPLLQDDPADLESEGTLDPETPREPLVLWRPGDGFGGAARLVAAQFTAGDRDWIAGLAAAGSAAGRDRRARLRGRGGARFHCVGRRAALSPGWSMPVASRRRIGGLALDGLPPVGRLAGAAAAGRTAARDLALAGDRGDADLSDDLAPLGAALAARAEAGAPALGDGPFRRRAVLALIGDCLEAANG